MRKILFLSAALLALSVGAASAQKTIKIGFVSTFSGPTAVIGNDMRNSFELALDHLGRKLGGQAVEVIYEDDGQKPDVGKQKTEKLVQSDKVDFIVGYIWSNVLLASLKTAVDSQSSAWSGSFRKVSFNSTSPVRLAAATNATTRFWSLSLIIMPISHPGGRWRRNAA